MKTTDSFSNKYTPRGEPVNYVEPPIINVDMFTDLVHQHTHAHRHNCSSISVLTGAAIICGLICSDLTSVCADAALFLCMYPSEHETPQWVHWHERLHRTLWGKKALLSFAIPVIHIPTNHCFKLCKVSRCNCHFIDIQWTCLDCGAKCITYSLRDFCGSLKFIQQALTRPQKSCL